MSRPRHTARLALSALIVSQVALAGCTGGPAPATTAAKPVTGDAVTSPADAAPAAVPSPAGDGTKPAAGAPQAEPAQIKPQEKKREKKRVLTRGLYLTGYSFGSEAKFEEILEFMKQANLNTIVVDAKDDDGLITFQSDIPLAREIGSNSSKIRDLKGRLEKLRENNIYSIARIVVFVDPVLAKGRPEWAILNGKWKDRRGLAWTSPYNENVWKYNIEVAKEAAKAGFDEIQFDYVRFPEHDIEGVTHNVGREKRVSTISGFLKMAKKELEPYPVNLSADVFGLTTSVSDDMKIGQDYAEIAGIVDFISPMIYPSHYGPGNYGLRDPESAPRETVYEGMLRGIEKTKDMPIEKHRPWIQDFSLRVHYGRAEVEAQLRGIAEAGIKQFLLWDPLNKYTRNVDFGVFDRTKPLPRPEPEKPAESAEKPAQNPQDSNNATEKPKDIHATGH